MAATGAVVTDAIIVDVDGTLCDVTSVRHHVTETPKDFKAFHDGARDCPPHDYVVGSCAGLNYFCGLTIIVVTARMYTWYDPTVSWLEDHLQPALVTPYIGPFMRGETDYRPDYEVKRDIHRILTEDYGYNIVGALDDNPSICALWEELGIPVDVIPGWSQDHD